jgi:ATP-binding cassette subfamily B protein
MNGQSVIKSMQRLWHHVSVIRRRQFAVLLLLMAFASFAEIFSIGAVLPFLAALTGPERLFSLATAQPIIQMLGLTTPAQLLLPVTIAFGFGVLVAGAMRMLLLWVSTRLSFATGADLGIDIYRRTLYQPYSVHCSRNSSEVISGISAKADTVIHSTIVPVLTLISSSAILIAILIALLALEPVAAALAFGGFGLLYAVVLRLTRKQLMVNGQRIAHESIHVIKSLQEGLGGIRDVLIDGSQSTYCQIYQDADIPLRRAQGENSFISSSPRFFMEAVGMLLIAALSYSLTQRDDGIAKAVPIIGALALGAQRLLPVMQQAYSAWTHIRSGHASLIDVLELLDQPLPVSATNPAGQAIPFYKHIRLNQLGFSYSTITPPVLKDINLVITKGSRVGFVGATGSGKSTLLDIVMGLLHPTIGTMEIDDQVLTAENLCAWQMHIAHVPQNIFLSDGTIEENIAFGVPQGQIDQHRVRRAAQQAQIANSIESLANQYQTRVGERGIRLSGGQRQRIGIARALYKQADVIVFDEATSALDNDTELAVMRSIDGLSKDLTLLIISHRISTLRNCAQIVELDASGIKGTGSYQDIVSDAHAKAEASARV